MIFIPTLTFIEATDVEVSNTDVEVFIPSQKTARYGTNGQVYENIRKYIGLAMIFIPTLTF